MWLIKNKIKVNWPLFFCNRMMLYKLDNKNKLPYPSFLSRDNEVFSVGRLLTTPSSKSGLDKGEIGRMHYY